MRKLKIGIALGGGGARGFAHIGVLRVLELNGIKPDIIAGTSMGALIGAMYSAGISVNDIEARLESFMHTNTYEALGFKNMPEETTKGFFRNLLDKLKRKIIFYLSDVKMAFMDKRAIDEMIAYFLPDADFSELKIPFSCVAVDITRGQEIVINKGSLRIAVASSMAIPGILPPVKHGDGVFVDGGVLQMVPSKVLKNAGCDFVIGIDVTSKLSVVSAKEFSSAFQISQRASDIAYAILTEMQSGYADYIFSPAVGNIKWYEMKRLREAILAGENEAMKKIPELKKRIKTKEWKTLLKRIFS